MPAQGCAGPSPVPPQGLPNWGHHQEEGRGQLKAFKWPFTFQMFSSETAQLGAPIGLRGAPLKLVTPTPMACRRRYPPTKFFQEKGLSSSFQDSGQAMSTVLCFMPPRPADWIRWDMPSRRLEDTTSWQKPLVFSALIRDRMFWGEVRGQCCSAHGADWEQHRQPPNPPQGARAVLGTPYTDTTATGQAGGSAGHP